MNNQQNCAQTPNEDLRRDALEHYENLSSNVCHWNSSIPDAINFYFDNKDKIAQQEDFKERLDRIEEIVSNLTVFIYILIGFSVFLTGQGLGEFFFYLTN